MSISVGIIDRYMSKFYHDFKPYVSNFKRTMQIQYNYYKYDNLFLNYLKTSNDNLHVDSLQIKKENLKIFAEIYEDKPINLVVDELYISK